MSIVLTIDQIYTLAEENNLRVTNYWQRDTEGRTPPAIEYISIDFGWRGEHPEAWGLLASSQLEVPVELRGTRRNTGSGATDGTLFPDYVKQLKAVNEKRKELGLEPILN